MMRCNNCNRPHQVKILDSKSTRQFNFKCRCLTLISGSYTKGSWEVANATVTIRDPEEAVFLHEPEAV
ncbi:MAG: hypothetical protein GPJ54_21395 [Candidatus Heimdallarchaeota archaeon]|nr:hypothetical protein [Candidatus Heimdallarchaeota archaeon]